MKKSTLSILILLILATNVMAGEGRSKLPKLSFRYAGALSVGPAIKSSDPESQRDYMPLGISGHVTLVDIPLFKNADLSILGVGAGALYGAGKHYWPYEERFWKKGTVLKFPIIYISGRDDNLTFGMWYGTNKYLHKDPVEEVHFLMFDIGITSLGRWFW